VDVATQILEGEVCCHALISVINEKADNLLEPRGVLALPF